MGLKLEVEPTVYLDNDVGIKVGMEVSSISKQIQNTNGSLTYQIGTRNASTVLRLKDGETQILAGLINKEDRKSANSVPILGQIPLLGRLFSSHSDSTSKTEVVLLITPRIVRNIVRPESPIEQFPSGTEASIGLERLEINRADNAKENMVAEPKPAHVAATEPIAKQTDLATLAAMPSMAVSATPSAQTTALLGNIKLTLEATAQVQSDKLFTVKVNLVAEGLQSALVGMSFDPAKLKVVSVTEGELLKRPDGKTQFFQQIQEKTGRLNFSVIRQGNVQGEGALASITFQSLEVFGSTQLRAGAVSFTDATGRVLPVNILPVATVEIVK